MKKDSILLAILFLLLSSGISMAQSNENERLKANLETAFAPKNSHADSTEKVNKENTSEVKNGQTLYYVQLFYSKNPDTAAQKKAQSALGKITSYNHNGYIKYCAGGFATQNEASALLKKAKVNGYPSAFIITLKDGKRID
ncbi:MAG: SPOR domain-containing protein [Flavobacteriales bacterium]|nr:SPOR domain-containing protein [Flavobacteriales bacterium]